MNNFSNAEYKVFIESSYGHIFEGKAYQDIPYRAIHEILCSSDDGSDGAKSFINWRKQNPYFGTILCVQEKIKQWNLPIDYDLNTPILNINWIETPNQWDLWVFAIDEMIIGVSIMQFILEKKVDFRLKELLKNTLERQLSKELLDYFDCKVTSQSKRKMILNELFYWVFKS